MPGIDFFEAELTGFGRRWNYGVLHSTGVWIDDDGAEHDRTIVALGVVESPAESVNGVVGWVDVDELTDLDRRERHYDRVDVVAATTVHTDHTIDGSIMVYVPKPESIEHYERARDAGRGRRRPGLLGPRRRRLRRARPRPPRALPRQHAGARRAGRAARPPLTRSGLVRTPVRR